MCHTDLAHGVPLSCTFQMDPYTLPMNQPDTTQSNRSLSGENQGFISHPRNSLLPRLFKTRSPTPMSSVNLSRHGEHH